jgi:hypothetical protein
MADQEQPTQTPGPQRPAEATEELSDEQLDQVAGGVKVASYMGFPELDY